MRLSGTERMVGPGVCGSPEEWGNGMKRLGLGVIAAAALLACSGRVWAETPAAASPRAIPEPGQIVLPTTGPVGGGQEEWYLDHGTRAVHNVTVPTLTPFLPPKGKANGTAIIVAPGGGFMWLVMDSEGYDVAKWLASQGIAAFVLKYRLHPTPATPAAMMKYAFPILFGDRSRLDTFIRESEPPAVEDAAAAVRLVRARSAQWGIDPKRVGFMGFSAGAITTLNAGLEPDPAARPDFIAPVYGPMTRPEKPVPSPPPPLWTALSADDGFFGKPDAGLLSAWREAGGSEELHFYARGGHGWGFNGAPGTTTVHWKDEFLWWLRSMGLINETAGKAADKN